MKTESKLSRYIDPTGEFSNRELQVGGWYLRHKQGLYQIFVGILITWCVIMVGFSSYRWAEYLIVGYWQDEDMRVAQTQEFVNYTLLQPAYSARPLQIEGADVYASAKEKYDFVTTVKNPNPEFVARVTYKYEFTGGETEVREQMVLPLREQLLPILGHTSDFSPNNFQLTLLKVRWQRVNEHQIPDANAYIGERLNFSLSPVSSTPATVDLPARVQFRIQNNSAYSLWEPVFWVELEENGLRQGVSLVTLRQFRSGESREVEIRPLSLSNVTNVRIIPVINVFDRRVFMPIGS